MTDVSVIIPVHNGVPLLSVQLAALAAQDYTGSFEVIVADNRSTDGLDDFLDADPSVPKLNLRVVKAIDKQGCGYTRNVGARAAHGELLAFCDHDDEVHPNWLSRIVAEMGDNDILTTAVEGDTLNAPGARKINKIRSPEDLQPEGARLFVAGCSFAVRARSYDKLGGCREDHGHEDVEFGWRAQREGFTVGYLPEALIGYRFRTTMRGNYRQGKQWGYGLMRLASEFPGYGIPRATVGQLLTTPIELIVFAGKFTRPEWAQLAGLWVGKVRFRISHR